ncbi:MAG: GntR family transcriptional regulator [Thermodesulfobacteriota bacterium]
MPSTYKRSAIRGDFEQARDQIAALLDGQPLDPHQSYTAQIHTRLRDFIVRGRLLPGMALSEAAIAAAMGISRTPVREALLHLVQEKLVHVYPQVGTLVAPLQAALIKEGCFVRSTLECANLMDLVNTVTEAQLDAIRFLLARQQEALSGGQPDAFFHSDDAIHGRMFEFTGRSRIWAFIQETKLHLDRVRWLLLDLIPEHAERVFNEHTKIFNHLAVKDAAGLGSAMQLHIEAVAGHLIELRKCTPESYYSD